MSESAAIAGDGVTEPAPPRRTGRPRSASADERILGAALTRLVEVGYRRLHVDDVAADAGVAKTTIYRRWPTKPALVAEAVRALYRAEVRAVDTGELRTDVLALLAETHALLFDDRAGHVLEDLVRESAASSDVDRVVRATNDARRRAFYQALDRGIVRGEISAGIDHDLVVDLLVGPLWTRRLVTGKALPTDQLAVIVDAVLDGAAGVPRPANGVRARPRRSARSS